MRHKNNYKPEAIKHEVAFRTILNHFNIPHQNLTIHEIYEKYSQGDRNGIWTILDFYQKEKDIFYFAYENIAILSGNGSTDLWKIENGIAVHLKNEYGWIC